jgi:hypothetical protein
MSRRIFTFIEIDSTPERVWEVLTDFDSYSEWNPFIRSISGPLREGARLEVYLSLGNGKPYRFTPRVTLIEEGRKLAWFGRTIVPRLFDGEHWFEVLPDNQGQCRFLHGELMTGLLSAPLWQLIGDKIERRFVEMNRAIKLRSETS